jgi:glucosamine kinase
MLLGDRGSGAWLGLEAVRNTAMVFDGFAAETELTAHVKDIAGHSMIDISRWAARATPKEYAALAPKIFDLAGSNETSSKVIVREGAEAITMLVHSLLARGNKRVCLLGGLAAVYPPYLTEDITSKLVPPKADALDGAILMARHNERAEK